MAAHEVRGGSEHGSRCNPLQIADETKTRFRHDKRCQTRAERRMARYVPAVPTRSRACRGVVRMNGRRRTGCGQPW